MWIRDYQGNLVNLNTGARVFIMPGNEEGKSAVVFGLSVRIALKVGDEKACQEFINKLLERLVIHDAGLLIQ